MKRLLAAAACLAALAAPASARADATVLVSPAGVFPPTVTVRAGEAVHWTNEHFLTQTITAADGLFDSGPIPAKGGYSLSLHVPGEHVYSSAANPLLTGTVRVIGRALGGAPDDLARDRIPELGFPLPDAEEIGEHPRFGTVASTRRILLRPAAEATVESVNAALDEVSAEIVGGLPSIGTLLVVVPEADGELGRFTGLAEALDSLRGSGAFESAAMSIQVEELAVPRRAEESVEGVVDIWKWDPDGLANWGLKDARFPEAWNLRESIARRNPGVVTGILDGGFEQHPDLTPQLHVVQRLCPGSAPCISLPNAGDEGDRAHGTHVAGIINASWDNPLTNEPPRSPRSKGVSGGNPFAKLHGVTYDATPPTGEISGFVLYDTLVSRFDAILRDKPEGLRVINYSAGARAFADAKKWTTAFPAQTCGPGATDDALPEVVTGAKDYCTQQNQDDWLREWAQVGMHARAVAELAAEENVLIVQAAGNDSDVFCLPWGVKSCPDHPETRRLIQAESSVEFAWASKHWQTGTNPILIVEATRSDGWRALYSNAGGDLAAPGTNVWSTWLGGGYGPDTGTSMAAPHVTAAVGYLLAFDPELTIEELKERLVQWSRPPPATPVEPTNVFEWDSPPRYGLDEDADGIVDAHVSEPELRPAVFPVGFDACGFAVGGKPIVSYRWTIAGEDHVTGSCRFRHAFATEGEAHVSVTFQTAEGDATTSGRDVVVDDLVLAAIGDGVVAGESARDTTAGWQDERCHRSGRGAAAQAALWLESAHVQSTVTFLNVACLGARIRGDGPTDGGLLTPYAGFEPADPPLAPQLDELANGLGSRTPDALLVSAGAGDLGLAAIVATCVDPATDCSTGEGKTIFEERLPVLPLRFGELASRIAELGVRDEHVLVAEYGDFTRDAGGNTDLSCLNGVGPAEAAWLGDTVLKGLNDELRAAAQRHGWTVVAADAFDKHGVCASEPWFGDTLHPTKAGHTALAEQFVEAFRAVHGETAVDPKRAYGDAAPRLDVFASLLATDGAAAALVDVNDPTADGNRRVVRKAAADGSIVEEPDPTVSPTGPKTSPDAYVDARDFRRFRDAWLATCLTYDADTSCPDPAAIVLDGPADHPKRDLNLDGCVHREGDPAECGVDEQQFSRFDFNGDRHVSVERTALVPLDTDGQPVEMRDEGTLMTDLDVLRSQWNPAPTLADGWGEADLEQLLRSADLEIHADAIFSAGALTAEVEVLGPGGNRIGPVRTITRRSTSAVVTVPVTSIHDEIVVVARGTSSGAAFTGRSGAVTLRYGEDVRVDVGRALAVSTPTPRLAADGASAATITARLTGAGRAGRPVTWSMSPLSGGAELQAAERQTDDAGEATAQLVAGTEPKTYTVRAEVELADGGTADAEVQVEVQRLVTIKYVWRQEIVDWSEEGSTRWDEADPLAPDCTLAEGIEYCLDESTVEIDKDGSPALLRRGTIRGGADSFVVTDVPSSELTAEGVPVEPGYGESSIAWTQSPPDDPDASESAVTGAWWSILEEEWDKYVDHPVEGITADEDAEAIRVGGLHVVGDLSYTYEAEGTTTQPIPAELHGLRTDFLLTEKDPESRIRFATGSRQEAVFRRTADGFEPFHSCGRLHRDLTSEPGYLVAGETGGDVLGAIGTVDRKPEYEPGDRPMPVGPGTLDIRYAFAATIAYAGEEPADPLVPDCGGVSGEPNEPPVASFAPEAVELAEGRMILFRDLSTDLEDEIVEWKWEHDGLVGASGLNPSFKATSTEQDPWFVFPDDGPVTVKLTVTDKEGATATVEKVVQIGNIAPEAYLADSVAQAGQPSLLTYAVMDTGDQDKRALHVRIESSNPDWTTVERIQAAGLSGDLTFTLPAGTYPLTLTVRDANGASSSAEALLVVSTEAPPPPPDEPGPDTPTCLDGVALDSEEQLFLDIVNDYRDANGLDPVAVSGTLSVAAAGHAKDMAENGYFAHEGRDGSTPSTRAWAAGYPNEHEVGENLARGFSNAIRVLLGWRGSTTGHNENMITPHYEAIGIGRHAGYWATSYGPAPDCPGTGGAGDGGTGGGSGDDPGEVEAIQGAPEVLSSLGGAPAPDVAPSTDATASITTTSAASPWLGLPATAFTVSRAQPRVGRAVTFTNRSEVPGVLELGGFPVPLAPGESAQHFFPSAGEHVVRLRNADGSASVSRTFSVLPAATVTLTYDGPTQGVVGKPLTLSARAGEAATATPVAGIELEFALAGTTVRATTDSTGVAIKQIDTTGLSAGFYPLTVRFAGDDDYPGAQVDAGVVLVVNTAPVAHAGGPYTAGEGTAVLLNGSRSTDADANDAVVEWRWDADGDGAFDDGELMTVPVQAATICGGACETDRDYPIALRVWDRRGDTGTATTSVRFTADFAVALAGGAMTVVPGSAPSHYGITVVGSASWTHPVTLSASGLPPGVTASFSVNPVTAPGTSVLTLTATSSAQTGGATVTVQGTSNGVTRSTDAPVSVAFGLVPRCYGTLTGVVTDVDTGAPVADALVNPFGARTDASGRYVVPQVDLGFNNQPVQYYLQATRTDYWPQSGQVTATCGVVAEKDFRVRRKLTGRFTGLVVDEQTGAAIPGALVYETSFSFPPAPSFTTAADGTFAGDLELGTENANRFYTYEASLSDYWPERKTITVSADATATAQFTLVRKCTARIGGGRVFDQRTGEPLAGISVQVPGLLQPVVTGADGRFTANVDLLLGHDNGPRTYEVTLPPQPSLPLGTFVPTATVELRTCGEVVGIDIPVRFPVVNTAAIEGYALDETTGQPIAGARISAPGPTQSTMQAVLTDASGFYRFDTVFVGYDATTSAFMFVGGSHPDYYSGAVTRTIVAGQVHRVDVPLLRKQFASLDATVRDAQTGAPIARVLVGSFGETGADGRLVRTDMTLADRNGPLSISASVNVQGYWPKSLSGTLRAGETTVLDYRLVRICAPARISGTVVNALTQAPIEGATVSGASMSARTDAQGRFELVNVPAGVDNLPTTVLVTASAPGFIPQQKQVTVYCGGSIAIDFGARSTSTSTIVGTVTNLDTGEPVAGAFVGGEHGGTATTDAAGNYTLPNVPLGDLEADREWDVTAVVPGFRPKTVAVVARAGQTVRADFGFTTAGNSRPVADPRSVRTDEDRAISPLTVTGSDADGDSLTYHVLVPPAHGRLRGVAPSLEYSPDQHYHGTDELEFVTFDGQDYSEPARVSIQVDSVNDPPFLAFDEVTRPAGVPARIPVSLVLANDRDVDGDTLTVTAASASFGATATLDGGDIVVSRLGPGDAYVSYSVTDGTVTTSATLLVHFVVMPVAPVCADASFAGVEDEPVAGQLACSDANGDALTYSVATPPAVGTLALQPGGSFTYTPPAGLTGPVTFRFRASDGALTSDEATATIAIAPANAAPVCADETFAGGEDERLAGSLACTDEDGDALEYELVSAPERGTVALDADGSFAYDPVPDDHGPQTFVFRASDGELESETAVATLAVAAVNDAPRPVADTATVAEDSSVVVDVLANDVAGPANEAEQMLSADVLSWPAHGVVTVTPTRISYTPRGDFNGTDELTYLACDDGVPALCATATLALDVTPVNDAPAAANVHVELAEDDPPLAIDLAALVGDLETQAAQLSYEIVAAPALGTLSGAGPVLQYDSHDDMNGADSFSYRVVDRGDPDRCIPEPRCSPPLASEVRTVTLAIAPVNDAPEVSLTGPASVAEGGSIDLEAAGTDVDGDPVEYTWSADAGTLAAAGNAATLSHPDGPATVAVTVVVSDGKLEAQAVHAVSVANVAPAVEAGPELVGNEGAAVVLDASFTDPGTDTVTVAVDWGDGSPLSTSLSESHVYADDGDYTVTVTVTDDDGDAGSATTIARIANVAPTVDAGTAPSSDEGLPVVLEASFFDPGRDTHTVQVDWGDGTPAASSLDAEHVYVDDGEYLVTVTAVDDDGGVGSDTTLATVRNLAPVVEAGADAALAEGSTLDLAASFSDAGTADTHTVTVDWGDGSGQSTSLTATHRYDDNGAYVVVVTVTDDDGGVGADVLLVTASNVPPTVDAGADATTPWGVALPFAAAVTDPSEADTRAGFLGGWSFGDGATAEGLAAEHPYGDPGRYEAVATVTDKDGGGGSDARVVTVLRRAAVLAWTAETTSTFGFTVLEARLTDAVDPSTARLGGRTLVFAVGGKPLEATTDATGTASVVTFLDPGEHAVGVSLAPNGHYDAAPIEAAVTVVNSIGKITGGVTLAGGGSGGFNVHGADEGELQWRSGDTRFHAHEVTALGIAPDRRRAWFAGVGTDGRRVVAYVEDNGEPGRDDIFRLWIAGVAATAGEGRLSGGNVQIH